MVQVRPRQRNAARIWPKAVRPIDGFRISPIEIHQIEFAPKHLHEWDLGRRDTLTGQGDSRQQRLCTHHHWHG